MPAQEADVVALRLDPDTLDAVDAVARATERDRQAVIGDALAAYLDDYRSQIAHIREGLRQADAGDFVGDAEVARVFRRDA